ncbi:unnamed protein product [Adineta ricciae]|uniref:EGF-like domain-containing protein n=1 Tax=Adineta ricciae TaxID=249248 RepID=A0A816CWB9_ADIRI|nr:unnamed protein product [Adineta ricciae]
MMNTSNLTNDEICQYLFRCALSDGFEYDCPCNKQNCTEMMINTCKYSEYLISYPPKGLINSNIIILYKYDHSLDNPSFRSFLTGNIKCRGYEFQTDVLLEFYIQKYMDDGHFINHLLCKLDNSDFGYRNISSQYQYDKFCWNNSLTFNGRPYAVNTRACSSSKECISQYRINDGSRDCFDLEDESDVLNKSYCTGNVGRHRFQCHNNERKCLPVTKLDIEKTFCSNRYDKSWYGNGIPLQNQLRCKPEETTDCHRIKEYIQQSSNNNSNNYDTFISFQQQNLKGRMFFQSHCDTFWNSDTHIDEMPSSCQYWVCRDYQYQCRTGQCIRENWVCDGEWDCPDASDEEVFVLIEKTSKHNNRLPNFQSLLVKCREKYPKSPFSNVWNTSFEFGCYLSQVSNPLNVSLYRPCINLTQIGDRIVDCYNAYDERNTFSINSNMRKMWGLHFRCADKHLSYESACTHLFNCTNIQCSYNRDETGLCSDKNDFVCLKENQCKKNGWCNGTFDCFYGEDEYWCSSHSRITDSTAYRYEKDKFIDSMTPQVIYPYLDASKGSKYPSAKSPVNSEPEMSSEKYSYQCNRGIAVLQMNETRCLCPPAYFGDFCQFFSDRISIIASVDQKTELTTILNRTLKIRANLLFNKQIVDHHEFHIVSKLEKSQTIKHRFYLLYSSTMEMLSYRRKRYFNRTDIITNHPYEIDFHVFILEKNKMAEEIGSWYYPIYFDYLPAFRLAVVLKFPSSIQNTTLVPYCQQTCKTNSNCLPIFNQNNSYYCSCKNGYFGSNFHTYEYLCKTFCSANALCRVDESDFRTKKKKPYCICPLGHFGARCHLRYNDCYSNICLNNGTCITYYDPSGENLLQCKCSEGFFGRQCENVKPSVHVHLNMTQSMSTRAVVIQCYDYPFLSPVLETKDQQLYKTLPSSVRLYQSKQSISALGILKIYQDLLQAQYFLIYCLTSQLTINITSSPQYCSHASSLLPKG